MDLELSGKVAVVTGASKGIGLAITRALADEGALVVAGARSTDTLDRLERVTGVPVDLASPDGPALLVGRALDAHGRLDVLVNNAGVFTYARLVDTSVEDYARQVDVNQLGVFLGMRAVAPTMIESRGGSIVNISSTAGLTGFPNAVGYVASKWAVRGMTKAVALELGRFGIRVNSIHPGATDTELLYQNPMMQRDDLGPVVRSIPLRRIAAPSEVAAVALFLASDEASYCTGGEYAVDGGVTAM